MIIEWEGLDNMDNITIINKPIYYKTINKKLLNPNEIVYRVQTSDSDYLYPKFRDEEATFLSCCSSHLQPYAFTKKALLTNQVLREEFINIIGVRLKDFEGRIVDIKEDWQ